MGCRTGGPTMRAMLSVWQSYKLTWSRCWTSKIEFQRSAHEVVKPPRLLVRLDGSSSRQQYLYTITVQIMAIERNPPGPYLVHMVVVTEDHLISLIFGSCSLGTYPVHRPKHEPR